MSSRTTFASILFMFLIVITGCRENTVFFAGGFTEGDEKGMALFEFEEQAKSLRLISEIDAGPSPTFFCFSERHRLIYALNEVAEFQGKQGGGVTTLTFNPENKKVEKVNEITVPYGGPCHISISADSGYLFVASYSSSSVAVIRLDSLGIPESVTDTILYGPDASNVSHPHMIAQDPAGRHVYLTDLGLDRIVIFDLDRTEGKLIPVPGGIIDFPEGSGPRHFVFDRNGSRIYVINELGSTIIVFNVDAGGLLHEIQTVSTISKGYEGKNQCAEILLGKGGKFLYGSNRGENTIVVFKVANDGMLSPAGTTACGGNWPRNFVIDPLGNFLICGNQRSDNISLFRINKESGLPEGPLSIAVMKQPAYIEFWGK